MNYKFSVITINYSTGHVSRPLTDTNPCVVGMALYDLYSTQGDDNAFGMIRFPADDAGLNNAIICNANFVNAVARQGLRHEKRIPRSESVADFGYGFANSRELLQYGVYTQTYPITYSARLVEFTRKENHPWHNRPTPACKIVTATSLDNLIQLAGNKKNWPYQGIRTTRISAITYRPYHFQPRPLPHSLCLTLMDKLCRKNTRVLT